MNYKISNYNNFVEYEDKIICFNAMSGALFAISRNLYQSYTKYKNDLDNLKQNEETLYKALIKTRFIIPKNYNELDIIKFRNRRDVFIDNFYKLTINPTLDCNFKCWYCYESHPKGQMTAEMMASVEKHVELMVKKNKISGLNLCWFGGEPLLYFDEIVYPLSINLQKIMRNNELPFVNSITTNGYLIEKDMIESFNNIGLKNFQITLDGNENRHNRNRNIHGKPTFRKIVNNINMLCENLKCGWIAIRINYEDETLNEIQEIISNFPNNRTHIGISFQRIWQTFDEGISLNEKLKEMVQFCEDEGFITSSARFNLYRGYKCYADKWHEAVVNYNGMIFKCTARDFTEENSCGNLQKDGIIKWKQEEIFKRFSRAAFENDMCLNCKLLPMCLGPCSQKIVETKEEHLSKICHLKLMEVTVEDFIINRYKQLLRKKEEDSINKIHDET